MFSFLTRFAFAVTLIHREVSGQAVLPLPSAYCNLHAGYREEKGKVIFRPDMVIGQDSPFYDCTQLGYHYDPKLTRVLDLTKFATTNLQIGSLNKWSTVGQQVFQYLPRNEPVYIVQAGTNLMTYAETDTVASLKDVYTTAATKKGLDLFMLIHGIDMIKTTGDQSSILLRGDEVTLKLSDKTNSGAEWVQTGGGESTIIITPGSGAKKIVVTKWDKADSDSTTTHVSGFTQGKDSVVCSGFDDKVNTCACVKAFDPLVTAKYRKNAKWAETRVPLNNGGCRHMEVKSASGDFVGNIAVPNPVYDCGTLSMEEQTNVNNLVASCNDPETPV
jgi:hypothetical protein